MKKVFPSGATSMRALFCLWAWLFLCGAPLQAQLGAPDLVKAEVERCQRRLREVRGEMLNRYESELGKLKQRFQKAADLEMSLVVRAEEARLNTERSLDSANLVEEPRSLRELQDAILQKQGELVAQVVAESVPKLVELKKNLTVAGRLDEAVDVRTAIVELQNSAAPQQKLSAGTQVAVEEVFQAYQISRERADKTYRGVKLSVVGRVAGVRVDPRDPGSQVLVLYGGGEGALVDCAFGVNEHRVREERVGSNLFFVVSSNNPAVPVLRVQRGGTVEIFGKCEGWDGALRFGGCSLRR